MNFTNLLDELANKNQTKLYLDEVSFFKLQEKLIIRLYSDKNIDVEILEKDFHDYLRAYNIDIEINLTSIFEHINGLKNIFSNLDIKFEDERVEILFSTEHEKEYFSNKEEINSFISICEQLDIKVSVLVKTEIDREEIDRLKKLKEEQIKKKIVEANQCISKEPKASKTTSQSPTDESGLFSFGKTKKIPETYSNIVDLIESPQLIKVKGRVFNLDYRHINTNGHNFYAVNFVIDDGDFAKLCSMMLNPDKFEIIKGGMKNSMGATVVGKVQYSNYDKDYIIRVEGIIEEILSDKRIDLEDEKRIEFNTHTKYSALESIIDINDLFANLKKWGHKSVAITDLFNVQIFPKAYNLAKRNGIKLNLGLQTNIYESQIPILRNYANLEISGKNFVVFDIETTGLSNFTDKIIEIGAVKIRDNEIIDIYHSFVDPKEALSAFTTELTGIDDSMVVGKREINEVLPDFIDFCKDAILVAHNAEFDVEFIIEKANSLNIYYKPAYMDTLYIARALRPDLPNHKLNNIAKAFNVSLVNHHRADEDAKATALIFIKMLEDFKSRNIKIDKNINRVFNEYPKQKNKEYQNTFYVKNKVGLKNLYKIVSLSNLNYINREPGIPEDVLENYREGLLLGTGNYKSKLFNLVSLKYNDEILERELLKFDFVTLIPIEFSTHLARRGYIKDKEHLIEINKKLFELASKNSMITIAVGDCYYFNKKDYIYRNIIKNNPRKTGLENSGEFYFRNTREMLDSFYYFSETDKRNIVIYNTHKLDEMIDNVSPVADGTFPPKIEDAENLLRELSYKNIKEKYGEDIPQQVRDRIERELNSIISNGYASLYMIASDLVTKSVKDGYLVGSRGSVGSSLAATMSDITEVNPLSPHYICPNCKYTEFVHDERYACGIDLPTKDCPVCSTRLSKEGFDIPFEVFLGFEGDKEPDIDLNFASVYQSKIHSYTESLFGKDKVFRAGTLGTIAEKTAVGFARRYKEFYPDDDKVLTDNININRVIRSITGVKRSTGQHPGGLVIVPEGKEIEDFTPVQYPADKDSAGSVTTCFEYHDIEKNLLKLDLLGHNVPTIIRLLTDLSGVDASKVALDDKETMSIFSSTDSLKIKHDYTNKTVGTLGIPEFGTTFVRRMLKDTLPTTFEELIRISGLSHGTAVWDGNAQVLISNNICTLKSAICTRDDIMNYLIEKGVSSKLSFDIMEKVRKGKGISEDEANILRENNVPEWYIESCNKIQYMFPKAHAVAYVMMSYRIAYFKVHHPSYFYAATFTNKIDDFKFDRIRKGLEYLSLDMKNKREEQDFKVDDEYYTDELAEEMYARGLKFADVDLYKSDPAIFTVIDDMTILPPLMAIPNVSEAVALSIAKERETEFLSIEDFQTRTKSNKNVIESMTELRLFEGLSNTNQLDFFSF